VVRLAVIVQDHGEVQAVPVLLRRIAKAVAPGVALTVARPIRVHRDRVLKEAELECSVVRQDVARGRGSAEDL